MKDLVGREIDYMRISITDRCNLRCKYCMPHGIDCVPRWDILSLEEMLAVAICAAGLGIRHIKVTGGEPLVRKDCCRLIRKLKAIPGIEKVTITTNGVLLDKYLQELAEAGIDGINISLDTLDRELYREITGKDQLGEVLSVIEKASALPIPVKINAVSLDFNDLENDGNKNRKAAGAEYTGAVRAGSETAGVGLPAWQQLTQLAARLPVDVRFIEMMPIGYGKNFKTISHETLLEKLREVYPGLRSDHRQHGFGPAVYYNVPGFQGSIGLISAIHGKFCDSCNRIRLTSQGYLKSCLCYEDGVDLRKILRNGEEYHGQEEHYRWPLAADPGNEKLQKELSQAMRQAIMEKPAAHCFEHPGQITEGRSMISIGG